MSYETALTVFVVFSIPVFILVVARLIMMKRQEKSEQAELDVVLEFW